MMKGSRWISGLTALLLLLLMCAAGAESGEDVRIMVRNGGSFVYVVRGDGSIVGWGDNRRGQLGTTPARLFLEPASL